uniref:Carboxylic ester hydrolase n=1 Tax=Cyberlindnera americana TaxID=36016 RepID=A0A5P8N8U6_9ASCO|nr:carboxylesterase [Cyberlindnera americana]
MGQPLSTLGATSYTHETPLGSFKGLVIRDDKDLPLCYRFAHVKYAQSTAGENRWKKPLPLAEDYDYSKESYESFDQPCPSPLVANPNIEYLNYRAETSEDCLYVNIWCPLSAIDTTEKLPVLFYIHGGWLQYGTPSQGSVYDPRDLLSTPDLPDKYIIVSPAYRLNAFGFLSGEELGSDCSNFGMWDQRAALEWTWKNISNFGGDPEKITVAGLSAGSYSTFFQLAYEMYHPEAPQIIKQVCHFSNALSVQPKTIKETQKQFDEFCAILNIDKSLSPDEKLNALRKIDHKTITSKITEMKLHTFRAITDDSFVSSSLLKDIQTGVYAKKLTDRGIKMIIGQVSNEPPLYGALNTPSSKEDLRIQLENYYPESTLNDLLEIYYPKDLSEDDADFQERLTDVFGLICADTQVTASTRGYLNNLLKGGFPESSIFRYYVDFCAKKLKPILIEHKCPIGVPHGFDQGLWFYSKTAYGVLDDEEAEKVIKFIKPYTEFISMKEIKSEWGTQSIKDMRTFNSDGSVSINNDGYWDEACKIADRIYAAQLH